jgi:hypothetical protein
LGGSVSTDIGTEGSRKIGTAVAADIGFTADVFTTEEDALNWLEGVK